MRAYRGVSPRLRFAVLRRDHFTCRYCGRTARETELQVDHLLAKAKGGADDEENLITACALCNQGKGVGPAPVHVAPSWQTLAGVHYHIFDVAPPWGPHPARRWIVRKGVILSDFGNGYVLVEEGARDAWAVDDRRLVAISTIIAEGWVLYGDFRAMEAGWERDGDFDLVRRPTWREGLAYERWAMPHRLWWAWRRLWGSTDDD